MQQPLEIIRIVGVFFDNKLFFAIGQSIRVLFLINRGWFIGKFFDLIKLYGPGYGLAATLIGQIGMFGSLGGSIEELGGMLAVAVTATMYGTVLANAIAGPIGDKLSLRSGEEILSKEMMLQGIMSIQAGDNPRTTTEKMLAFVPQSGRGRLKLAA